MSEEGEAPRGLSLGSFLSLLLSVCMHSKFWSYPARSAAAIFLLRKYLQMHFVSGSPPLSEIHFWSHSRKLFWQIIYSTSMALLRRTDLGALPCSNIFAWSPISQQFYRINSNRKVSLVAHCEDARDLKGSLPFPSQPM